MLERLRLRLAGMEALPQLALLGALVGLLSGAVIIAFRQAIEQSQAVILPGGGEDYESLGWTARLLLPTLGGLALGLLFQAVASGSRQVGVVHVMERLAYHQGHLPIRNAVMQFVGAAASIVSGHSVGREGPGIHLGATAGSQLGLRMGLPNNSIRILVGCGVAAAIGASFNTPIAGVIFAMEVVMMEYTITGFAPVILAAVTGTALTRAVYGADPAFSVPSLQMVSLWELPYVLLLGLTVGALSAMFIHLLEFFAARAQRFPLWVNTTVAGALTGICALAVPQIMGIGYDTVSSALLGELGLGILLGVAGLKLLATTAGLGLGLPGGLIGPTLVIGATAGGAMGVLAAGMFPGQSTGFYAMVGMGAMMGATLQAPLAALMAMLELTANPNIILPGMLAVITSGLTSQELFGKGSVYLMLMRARGLDYRNDPRTQSLRRVGVASVMERNLSSLPEVVSRDDAMAALEAEPAWIVVEKENQPVALVPPVDLARHLSESDEQEVNLLEFPALRRELAPINFQATLQEAVETLDSSQADALFVWRISAPTIRQVYGVVTRQDIEAAPLH